MALWNRRVHEVDHADWWPCWKEDFSDILLAFLQHDIGGDRVIINREVQVSRSGFPVGRTDIQVEALARDCASDTPLKVVIECKGCWNKKLKSALDEQLVNRYLGASETAGLYLTAFFHCAHWAADMHRGCPAQGHTLAEIRQDLLKQALSARTRQGVLVTAVTLDCALRDGG